MTPPSAPSLRWLFVDMNSFFASAEQHMRPELRGRPIGIIPLESEGTCVIAASKEAKDRGVKMGTGAREARVLCPGIELIKARPDEYVRLHHAIAQTIERCAPLHKAYSIDEWAIRLGHGQRDPESAAALGRRIKTALLEDYSPHLTCSIGIAPSRLLAKIGSDLQKPDGLTVLQVSDLPDRLEHCSLQSLCGIGAGTATRLEQNGIHSVRELWQLDRRQSIQVWGSVSGAQWWAGFHGHDEPEAPTRKGSMSHASVLDPRLRNDVGARGILTRLVYRLGVRLRSDGYLASAMGIYIVYVGGEHFSTNLWLPQVQDTPTLLESLYRLWNQRPLRHAPPLQVGAVVHGLVPVSQVPGHLFERAQRVTELSHAMDKINRKWGLSSIYFGSMHDYCHQMDDKIAFGRIPPRAGSFAVAEKTAPANRRRAKFTLSGHQSG